MREPLAEFYSREKGRIPPAPSLLSISSVVSNSLKKVTKEYHDAKELCDSEKETLEMWKELKSGDPKLLDDELSMVEDVIIYLMKIGEKAKTFCLKNACENAQGLFNIATNIKQEFHNLKETIRNTHEKLVKLKEKRDKIYITGLYLENVKSAIERKTYDFGEKMSLLMLMEKNVINLGNGADLSVGSFKAFDGVEDVFDINSVMERRLVKVGPKVKMSEPITVDIEIEKQGGFIRASLSHNGVLAVYSLRGRKKALELVDLVHQKRADVEVEKTTLAGFYDDKILLLTFSYPLREALLSDVFEKQNISVFDDVGKVGVNTEADVTLLNLKRKLYYTNRSDVPYMFDVDKRTESVVKIEVERVSFASLMGIDVNINAIFQDLDDKNIFLLNKDMEISPLRKTEQKELGSVFVSESKPRDSEKFVLKFKKCFSSSWGTKIVEKPVKFNDNYSIIRVYKDVFLLYDSGTREWVLSRIIIP